MQQKKWMICHLHKSAIAAIVLSKMDIWHHGMLRNWDNAFHQKQCIGATTTTHNKKSAESGLKNCPAQNLQQTRQKFH